MQALEGSSPGARDALLALSVDLRLPHHAVIKALEYAWDNSSSHSNAAEALDFGFILQGCFVEIRFLDMALQRLRRNFGSQCCGAYRLKTGLMFQGILGVSTAQHVSLQEWSAQPSAWGSGRPSSRSAVTAQHVSLQEWSAQPFARSIGQLSQNAVTAPAQHASLQEWPAQASTWSGGQSYRSAVSAPSQHVSLQERSAQNPACSGGQPVRREVPAPTQPTTTTVPDSSKGVFNSNSNAGISYQHTAAWSGSSQLVSNPNIGNGYQQTSAWSGASLPESWSTSQQMSSASGTHVTGSPNVANNPAEVQFTGRSTSLNPSYPHNTPRSGP